MTTSEMANKIIELTDAIVETYKDAYDAQRGYVAQMESALSVADAENKQLRADLANMQAIVDEQIRGLGE